MLQKAGYAFYYLVRTYVIILLFSVGFLLLLYLLGIDNKIEKMPEIIQLTDHREKVTLLFLFSTLFLAPLLEELIFRHPLKDFQTNFKSTLLALAIMIILSLLSKNIVGILILMLGVIYCLNWLLLEHSRIHAAISSKAIYVMSFVFFVVAHFGRFEVLRSEYWPLYVLYGAHMAICAYFLADIRLRRDTSHGILLHFLYNLVPVLVLFL